MLKVGPEHGTFNGTRDPRPGTHLIDLKPRIMKVGPETRDSGFISQVGPGILKVGPETLKVNFLEIFSVFSDASRLLMNSCTLCVYVDFVCSHYPITKYIHL